MKNHKKKNGFTLIELLIVIAIIGVLASIVVGSVNYARTRGTDTAIAADMDNALTQSGLYYDDNEQSYAGLCDIVPTANDTRTINENLLGAQSKWGTTTQALNIDLNTAGAWDTVTCHEDGAAFSAEVPLKGSVSGTPRMWCIDSQNASKETAANLAIGDIVCP